ncbi:hypothetical protein [Actinokineospora globicatena]|uniref:hypothetical protein n=1 Tax=Actinokineospora globicatena TaxID=103729 RepID=UPI0020A3E57C|nr:hypothetical protein [Actinokineospora globicatena]MCP2306780.1 hypothetical protein [Actinokineospora globicatena]GLW82097.1 hypothetical protein Aglo01_65780 [Actinokineospora globicatena]GLW88890.1 hypothetical protein Aglo02_65290 [Actinokineospora globicatena]
MNVKRTLIAPVLAVVTAALTFGGVLTATADSAPAPAAGRSAMTQISRSEVLARARSWVERAVPYSNTGHTDGYRQDCSGFVAMVWGLGDNPSTRMLSGRATPVDKAGLRPGDILLWVNPDPTEFGHVRVFGGWTDPAQTGYWVYEQTPVQAVYREYTWTDTAADYVPYRGNTVVDDTPTTSTPSDSPTGVPAPPSDPTVEVTPPTRTPTPSSAAPVPDGGELVQPQRIEQPVAGVLS